MYPILADIGPWTIHSYGFFIALAFALGMWVWQDEAEQRALQTSFMPALAFLLILACLLGGRLTFLLNTFGLLWNHPGQLLAFWEGGLNFWGGAIAAGLVFVSFLHKHRQPLLSWADSLAPALAVIIAVSAIGFLLSGSFYGQPADLPWAVIYGRLDSQAPLLTPLHPTQIYLALAGILLYILLILFKNRSPRSGQLFSIFLMAFSVLYFTVSSFRGDVQLELAGLLWPQWLSVVLFLTGIWVYNILRRS